MKTILSRALASTAALLLSHGFVAAQSAKPLDASAAQAVLSQSAKKPRFIPKSAAKSHTYTRTPKGVDVEVIEYEDGQREEHPYVAIPILFVKGQDALLDAVSADNLKKTATILRNIIAADPKASFTIQGHTSAEGNAQVNHILSEGRARKILSLLTDNGVDTSKLSPKGLGADFSTAPADAPEGQLQKDRRVLVVRQ